MKKNALVSVIVMTLAVVTLMSFTINQQEPKPWPVPAEYKTMKNPVKADAESIQVGKMLYNRNCASCHGKNGLGDGPKARMLETFAGDFSADYFQNQTDGELFYKTEEGREEMPGYGKKLTKEDTWNIVNYMRTFKK